MFRIIPAGENEYNDVDENENGDNEVNITGKVTENDSITNYCKSKRRNGNSQMRLEQKRLQ
jgi:hypothetical protein